MSTQDLQFMALALAQAREAARQDEVPVGAVIVRDGAVIAQGYNLRERARNALMHAELVAIDNACKSLDAWRLAGCDLYVTLEPCPMCCGAIINARIRRVVFGAYDPKAGCCGSMLNLFEYPFNHMPEVLGGVAQEECAAILSEFFQAKRLRQKAEKRASEPL